ncbi:MAG TPA: dihydropteroate synthase [Candidatus Saccharimonadia bacterium]|nr:dihydropteroate synthase [Candidatus Saccharimonadia bacterium]
MKLRVRDKIIDLDEPVIMGVLNVTPDSFSGDGVVDVAAALEQARVMVGEGARVIDVGGESSRPGAQAVSLDEELRRVVPVVERLARETTAVISVDTAKPEVAQAVLEAGAHIINDITGLRDERMAGVVAKYGAAVVLMHMQGTPETMQRDPQYDDVVREVAEFWRQRTRRARAAGVGADQIVLDPGIGFGKTMEHNLELLRATRNLVAEFREPVLIGASRKGFIGRLTGHEEARDRVFGTVALTAMVVRDGAAMVRVHDVAANLDAVKLVQVWRDERD